MLSVPGLGRWGGNGGGDFQQAGLISCAGSCPGQCLGTRVLDQEQRPSQAGVITVLYHFSYVPLFSLRFWKSWTSSFHELNICRLWRLCPSQSCLCPDVLSGRPVLTGTLWDVLPLSVSGTHRVWALSCLRPQRTGWSGDLRNPFQNALGHLIHSDSRIHSGL